ncbi:MAG: hypothetical protein ACAI25_20250 [Planctomycetota bacterium]
MTAESLPDPKALLTELEGAFSQFDEARMRLHHACIGAAQGLSALGARIERLEADLETAKNHLLHQRTEGSATHGEQSMRIAVLEGEIAALKTAHDASSSESANLGAEAAGYHSRIGELEGTVSALNEHLAQVSAERDVHGQHAAAVEGELVSLRDEVTRLREELERASSRLKKTSSSTKIPVAAPPPPVPAAKAFAEVASRPAEKPPGSLDVDALLQRAKSVKKNGEA